MTEFPSPLAGKEICEILGIDPNRVSRLSVHIEQSSLISVTAVIHPDINQFGRICRSMEGVMKTFELVERKQTE